MSDAEAVPRKRRTAAELRAFHTAEAKKADEREKAEVLRLVSDAHDTLAEAMSLEAAKPSNTAFANILAGVKGLVAAFTPPKK